MTERVVVTGGLSYTGSYAGNTALPSPQKARENTEAL